MPQNIGGTIIKLLVLSLVVGMLLKFLNLDPENLLSSLGGLFEWFVQVGAKLIDWGLGYVLIGAAVVIPIYVVIVLIRIAKGKRGNS